MSFLEVIVENLDHYPDPGPEKKRSHSKADPLEKLDLKD